MPQPVPPKVHHVDCMSAIPDHLDDCPVPRVRCVARTTRGGRCEDDSRLRSNWCPTHWRMRLDRQAFESEQLRRALAGQRR